jgi:hypothetical protein
LSVTLTPIEQPGCWRVRLTWPEAVSRYFGKFQSQAEAEKWISEHRWLTEQRKEPDVARADDPEAPTVE